MFIFQSEELEVFFNPTVLLLPFLKLFLCGYKYIFIYCKSFFWPDSYAAFFSRDFEQESYLRVTGSGRILSSLKQTKSMHKYILKKNKIFCFQSGLILYVGYM